jgi:hypothetical protein
MNGIEIERAARLDPLTDRQFLGVYARDRLPRRLPHGRCSFIANTDPASRPGTHWVAFYFDTSRRIGEYFDTFGQAPSTYPAFDNYLRRHAVHVRHNVTRIQSVYSTACGHYCVYYLHNKSRGKSLDSILTRFGPNCARNDRIVFQWYGNRYGHVSTSMPSVLTFAIERQLHSMWR